MQFDKTQKRALVFVAGLLGLSWYMGNQFEKADMMRSEADAEEVFEIDFEDFKRKLVGDKAVAGDLGYMEALEEFYEDYLEDIQQRNNGFSPEPETFEEFQERKLREDYEDKDFVESLEAETHAYTYAYNEGHSDSRKDKGYQPTLASAREEARFRKILKQRAENFNAPATKKPKLTKTQLEDLNRMKASTFYGSGGYAYVEVDNRGMKPYTTRPVQALLDKGIITIPKNENRRFYGRVESMEAYIVYLNPVAWEYPFRYDYDKSLSQVGDKIVQNKKIQQQEHARILKQKQDEENMTLEEVLDELFGAETFRAENMLYILEHYTVNWREGGDSVEYHIGTSLMNLADALTDALDTLEEHNRHEEWCEDAKTDEEYEDRVERWKGRDGEDENGLLDLLMEVQGDGYGSDNLNRYTLTVKEAPVHLRGSSEYYAETFNAPYAGSGSLMNIGQDTSLGNFTSKELTESSAVHGDFNEASLNYSGHQNLQVREAETMTPSEVKVKVTKDVTPKGSKVIVEECVDIQAHKADATANFYRVRFRDPTEMSNFRVPAWAARAANTMGSKYYDVAGSKVTMGQDKSGNWKIQSVMVPKRANVDVELALKIANHIQDRLEKEGRWASKKCQDNERILIIR